MLNLRQSLKTNSYRNKINEILDIHTKNTTLYPDFDITSSLVIDTMVEYNSELGKEPGERDKATMLKALTLPHDFIHDLIQELAQNSTDIIDKKIEMFQQMLNELEEIKFLVHDLSSESSSIDDKSYFMLSIYQQAFITSRDILNRMNKLSEAIS